jgi:hypothetical protein
LRTFSEKGCLNQSEEMNPQTQGKAFIPWKWCSTGLQGAGPTHCFLLGDSAPYSTGRKPWLSQEN